MALRKKHAVQGGDAGRYVKVEKKKGTLLKSFHTQKQSTDIMQYNRERHLQCSFAQWQAAHSSINVLLHHGKTNDAFIKEKRCRYV